MWVTITSSEEQNDRACEPRFPPPVFDCLQHTKTEGGLGDFVLGMTST